MDVAALAQTILSGRSAVAQQDAQISVMKKVMDSQHDAASKLIDSMSMPLATEGSLGRNVNTYA